MTEQPTTYTADIPPEPDGVTAVIDRQGVVWQRIADRREGAYWTSRHRVQGLLGGEAPRVTWRDLLFRWGPVTSIPMPPTPEAHA